MKILLHTARARADTGGASISTWDLAASLRLRGHQVSAVIDKGPGDPVRPGVPVASSGHAERYAAADVVLTHAATLIGGNDLGQTTDTPVACIVRGAVGRSWIAPGEYGATVDACIWGSAAYRDHAIAKGTAGDGPHHVMWPAIDGARFRTPPGRTVMLVGAFREKGVDLFLDIARAMPDQAFTLCLTGWARKQQAAAVRGGLPRNVDLIPYQTDAREIYRRTRIILWMRGKDAGPEWLWGVPRVVVEAAASGIPCVSHPGDGIRECMGAAPLYVDSHDPDAWVQALRKLDAPTVYNSASVRTAEAFAAYPDPETIIDGVETFLESVVAGVPA